MAFARLRAFAILATLIVAGASGPVAADSKAEIDAGVDASLTKFYATVGSGKALADKAEGMLVFPSIVKAGFGIGGEYGEGALRVGGKNVAYYSTAAASIGLQIGAQARSQIIMFMTEQALAGFRGSAGWEVGVDGSVALIELGAGGQVDTNTISDPIIGFIFGNKGLMYNLTLEGSKITKLDK